MSTLDGLRGNGTHNYLDCQHYYPDVVVAKDSTGLEGDINQSWCLRVGAQIMADGIAVSQDRDVNAVCDNETKYFEAQDDLAFSSPQSLLPAPNAVNTLAECWDRCDRAEQLQPYGCKGISWDPSRKACHYMILDTNDFGRGDVQLEGSLNRDLVSLVSAPCWRQRDYLGMRTF